MEIALDPIREAVITPPLDPSTDNVGTDTADIAERMHANGMDPDEILQKIMAGPLVGPTIEVD